MSRCPILARAVGGIKSNMGCRGSKDVKRSIEGGHAKEKIDGIMSHMVRERKDGPTVDDLYEHVGIIGKGSVGMISKVRHRQTGVEYALKTIQLEKISPSMMKEMRNEIEILKRLDHPNTIRAIETFETNERVYLVMKLCTGGDLRSRAPYSEKSAANIVTKLLSAILYMHEKGICHRDLKLENVVYESKAPDADIFIIDYGLSKIMDGKRMHEVVGTLYTMAPEVIAKRDYDCSCDMWSIGVIAFVLLSGDMPFPLGSRAKLIRAIEEADYHFSGRRWDDISYDARNFVRHTIVKNPRGRLTADQALHHRWIRAWKSDNPRARRRKLTREDHDRIVTSMKNYASYSKVKKTGLMLVAYRSTPEETKAMRDAFLTYDVDLNGRISRDEFQAVLKQQGYTDKELVGLFDEVDEDHDGYMHYTEFIAATLETAGKEVAEERLADAFDQLDTEEMHYISKENLVQFLGKDAEGYDIATLIEEADESLRGGIDLEHFIKLMRKTGRFTMAGTRSPLLDEEQSSEQTVGDDKVGYGRLETGRRGEERRGSNSAATAVGHAGGKKVDDREEGVVDQTLVRQLYKPKPPTSLDPRFGDGPAPPPPPQFSEVLL